MALKSRLGFGMMRLPVKNGNPTDFDYDELNRMVDTFIEAGYTYFDTSYVYHPTTLILIRNQRCYFLAESAQPMGVLRFVPFGQCLCAQVENSIL